jgi:hypothetical protein
MYVSFNKCQAAADAAAAPSGVREGHSFADFD